MPEFCKQLSAWNGPVYNKKRNKIYAFSSVNIKKEYILILHIVMFLRK